MTSMHGKNIWKVAEHNSPEKSPGRTAPSRFFSSTLTATASSCLRRPDRSDSTLYRRLANEHLHPHLPDTDCLFGSTISGGSWPCFGWLAPHTGKRRGARFYPGKQGQDEVRVRRQWKTILAVGF